MIQPVPKQDEKRRVAIDMNVDVAGHHDGDVDRILVDLTPAVVVSEAGRCEARNIGLEALHPPGFRREECEPPMSCALEGLARTVLDKERPAMLSIVIGGWQQTLLIRTDGSIELQNQSQGT